MAFADLNKIGRTKHIRYPIITFVVLLRTSSTLPFIMMSYVRIN